MNIAYKSVKELSNLIQQKEVSPVELLDATIDRIETRNKETNSFVFLDFVEAKERAKIAEQQVINGEKLGLLHGIPTATKDFFGHKPGWPTTLGGIPALKDNFVNSTCLYAERTEKAGAITVGKTNSAMLGFRGVTDNPLFGPTRSPFNLAKNSGGSSGGSAAAVADGLIPIAEGTDGGGSIRIPSAWCGTYGFQASYGRVPRIARPNAFGSVAPFLYEGSITRTVEDAAIAMTALTGYDPRDPLSLNDKVNFLGALRQPMKGWKIAFSPDFDVYPVDERIKNTVQKAVKLFEEAGAHVEEVKFGLTRDLKEYSDLWCRMVTGGSVAGFEGLKQRGIDLLKDYRDDLPDELIYWVEHVYEMKTMDHMKDQMMRTEIFDAIQNVFNDYDLIVTPTLACLPVDNTDDGETKGPTHINGQAVDPLIGFCLTFFTNFTGHPAASIPAGLVDNLPVGMQIIGKRLADADVITASSVFEQLKPWQDMYQICENRNASSVNSNS